MRNRLELDVGTLDQLNSSVLLLEEVRDMENKIDSIYLPIETLYNKLRYTHIYILPTDHYVHDALIVIVIIYL